MICMAKQDITKYESSSAAPRPGLVGEDSIDFSLMSIGNLRGPPILNKISQVRAEIEEEVMVLLLVSPTPADSKPKNDNYFPSLKIYSQESSSVGLKRDFKLSQANKSVDVKTEYIDSQVISPVRAGFSSELRHCSTGRLQSSSFKESSLKPQSFGSLGRKTVCSDLGSYNDRQPKNSVSSQAWKHPKAGMCLCVRMYLVMLPVLFLLCIP